MTEEDIRKHVGAGLEKFVGQKAKETTIKEIEFMLKSNLAKLDANLHGYEVLKVDSLWNMFSLKDKMKWYWINRITSKGQKLRTKIDQDNHYEYLAAVERMKEDPDPEACVEDYYDPKPYPDLYTLSPRSIVKTEVKIKPAQPLEFIGVSLQIDELESR